MQTKLNKAVGENKALVMEINSYRKMKRFEKDTDIKNFKKLRTVTQRVGRASRRVKNLRTSASKTNLKLFFSRFHSC